MFKYFTIFYQYALSLFYKIRSVIFGNHKLIVYLCTAYGPVA